MVRYRLAFLQPDETGLRYTGGTKEFRSLRHLLEYTETILQKGGEIRGIEKWTQGEWTEQERHMVEFWFGGKVKV